MAAYLTVSGSFSVTLLQALCQEVHIHVLNVHQYTSVLVLSIHICWSAYKRSVTMFAVNVFFCLSTYRPKLGKNPTWLLMPG